ncbi:MAG: hypothetical protein F6K62_18685 [Sphaerospermopsis sp. SIO1G2]|nr:hypothetical protein [Sphaerospermopsis sp. SIO1G1]NET72879.1 hypothetical protein [Sphaerospermopsis sp. SIO1G2]
MTSNSPDPIEPTEIKSLEEYIKLNAPAIFITDANAELVKEIQQLLKIGVDGIVGPTTKQAFIEFKAENELQYPLGLGVTTAQELLKLKDNEEAGADQEEIESDVELNLSAGSKTGRTMRLPEGKIVYANEYIVEGIPLTWGEATKNCTRIPTSSQYVANAIRLAKTWGEVRDKFGSPIRITSAYRPPAVNRRVGGVRNSQHLYFRALDMQPLNGDFRTLWEILKASKFTGLGDAVFMRRNKGFFHADTRPSGRVIFPY